VAEVPLPLPLLLLLLLLPLLLLPLFLPGPKFGSLTVLFDAAKGAGFVE